MPLNIPTQMRALVLTEPGKFNIQDVPVPEPQQNEVLCKVRAVAICGSDPEIVRGGLAGIWPPAYPFIPGHEWSGEVIAVGEGVVGLKPGDRVAGQAHSGLRQVPQLYGGTLQHLRELWETRNRSFSLWFYYPWRICSI